MQPKVRRAGCGIKMASFVKFDKYKCHWNLHNLSCPADLQNLLNYIGDVIIRSDAHLHKLYLNMSDHSIILRSVLKQHVNKSLKLQLTLKLIHRPLYLSLYLSA